MRNLALALTLSAKDAASKVLRQAMQDGIKQTKAAEKAGDNLAKSQQQNAATGVRASRTLADEYRRSSSARSTLGIRSEREIQREIQQTQAAYQRLTRSGVMSANEQSRAFSTMTQRVGRLRDELKGTGNELSRMERARGWGSNVMAIAGGVAAAGAVVAQPVKNQMSYEQRLANMANTAYAEQGVTGRRAGMQSMDQLIRQAVTNGGGTKEGAADTLDSLLASGAVSMDSAKTLLPLIQRYSTATGAAPTDLAQIAIRAKQTFGIQDSDMGKAFNMAISAGQSGSFELADMAKWLPQQLAAASNIGMKGLDDFSVLLGANQAAAITAGTSDEAGNNVVNLLAKISSSDAAKAAAKIKVNGKGIDLPGSLSAARGKGINTLDAFVGIIDKVVGSNPAYKKLEGKLSTAQGGERQETIESMAKILEGSAVGEMISDRQALMALIGYRSNKKYAKDVIGDANKQRTLPAGQTAGDLNYELISGTNAFKVEQLDNARDFGQIDAIKPLSDTLGSLSSVLADYAKSYPGLTTALSGAEIAIKAMTDAAVVFAGIKFFSGSGGKSGGGLGIPGMPGGLGGGVPTGGAIPVYVTNWQDGGKEKNGLLESASNLPGPVGAAAGSASFVLALTDELDSKKKEAESKGVSIGDLFIQEMQKEKKPLFDIDPASWFSPPTTIGTGPGGVAAFGSPSYLTPAVNQKPQPIQVTTKVVLDERVLAETVNEYNNNQAGRGPTGMNP
ncbi:phage tail tape measure protein [Serratia sp. 14-2641]|uniref:phage tail tape measure protein n=1 Tax=Serratia sp. 14-2641 TaxID=1841657 RepID=UPI000810155F|nr:phage tail tape measure protein [Serratia sp. 14-2641]OCJ24608.1 phage tail tape measure protein [Serratia sp. 14-2641]